MSSEQLLGYSLFACGGVVATGIVWLTGHFPRFVRALVRSIAISGSLTPALIRAHDEYWFPAWWIVLLAQRIPERWSIGIFLMGLLVVFGLQMIPRRNRHRSEWHCRLYISIGSNFVFNCLQQL